MAKRSLFHATNILNRLYASQPRTSTITRAQIFRALGRDVANEKDVNAVYSQLSALRQHSLIDTKRNPFDQNKLVSITLTEAGRRALGRTKSVDGTAAPGVRVVTLETVLADIRTLREQLPSFEIELKVDLKDTSSNRGSTDERA